MQLVEFIDKIKTPIFDESSVFYFKSDGQYPLIFFSLLIKKLRKNLAFDIETISLSSEKMSTVKSKLSTMFLGQKKLYWLEDISSLKGKEKTNFVAYLQNYSGPNIAGFFSDGSIKFGNKCKTIIVEIANFVDKKTFIKLIEFCEKPVTKLSSKILSDLFSKNNKLTLDTCCMLFNYTSLVGRQYKEFSEQWVKKIIVSEKSLFTLSQYFFDKNPKLFFELWLDLKDDYQEPFWIAFWSEQIWRACNVIKFIKNKNMADARKISFRLPFSFMQRSWRDCTFFELTNAHDFLYSVDFSLKNGGDPFSLDLFYSKFLTGQFVQKPLVKALLFK